MPDDILNSVHLDGQKARLERFREAREVLKKNCGPETVAGDMEMLADNDPGDGVTVIGPPNLAHAYWLSDGRNNYELYIGINSVGRLPDNNVVIRDEHISRRHFAVVIHADGRSEVHDIASKNGTVLNGKKIEGPTVIKNGDVITICTKRLKFVTGDPPSIGSKNREQQVA